MNEKAPFYPPRDLENHEPYTDAHHENDSLASCSQSSFMSAGREVTTMEFAERPLQRRFGPFMRWCRTWTILAGILLLAFIGSVWMKRDAIPIPQLQTGPQNQDSLSRLFQELYAPIKPAVTQPSVTGTDGKEYRITTEPQWEKSLGSKVLILDMDTRSLHGENQILNNNTVPWENIEQGSSGLLNHYMYSLIHGYSYKLIQPQPLPSLFASWVKPGVMGRALQDYRIVVFSDADAVWNQPEVPLEWLLNHWNITPLTSLSISLDPSRYTDTHGRNGLNTGFIIAQQSPRTQEILASWSDCPSGKEFPGCEEWANKRVFEQTAFNEYVRYKYSEEEDLRELPCTETDGFPGDERGCDGVFIRHFWRDKGLTKGGVADPIMRTLTAQLHEHFLEHTGELVEEDNTVF